MSAGIEVYNNSGVLQITDQFKNLQFREKDTVSLTNENLGTSDWYSADIILSDTQEFLCFNVNTIDVPVLLYGRTFLRDNVLRSRIATKVAPGTTPNVSVNYYRFGYATVPRGNFFEVRNASGEMVFSDAARFMQVIAGRNGTETREIAYTDIPPGHSDSTSAWWGVYGYTLHSVSIPTGKTVAVLLGTNLYTTYMTVGYENPFDAWNPGDPTYSVSKQTNSGFVFREDRIEFWNLAIYDNASGADPLAQKEINYNYLLIDVTGL